MALPFIVLYLPYSGFNGHTFSFSFVLQILLQVLDMVPSYFGIRLAALGSRKELVDLENWLSSNLTTYKDVFFEVMIKIPPPPLLTSTTAPHRELWAERYELQLVAHYKPSFFTTFIMLLKIWREIVNCANINVSATRSASNSWRRFNLASLRMFLLTILTILVVFRTFIRRRVLLSWRFCLYQLVVFISHT